MPIYLTRDEAKKFIFIKQGLLGKHKFLGKQGIMDYINQAGCIQYDPIDICGKNSELVLQSRIKGFTKNMLYDLLYKDRVLIDFFDKNLAIMNVGDWIYFKRIREGYSEGRSFDEVNKVKEYIFGKLNEKEFLCSKDLELNEKADWYWSSTRLSRVALENLYFRGELIIHHKKGTNKYYSLAKNYLPSEILNHEEPFINDLDHKKWRVLRRIKAVGMLWNRPSDAWLNIWNLKAEDRHQIFNELLAENCISEVVVEGIKDSLYIETKDVEIINDIKNNTKFQKRIEFIAPLDGMLWDRNLIEKLFDFYYRWEIYTPESKRKYGYYVLPIIYGTEFIGRIEMVCKREEKILVIKNIWFEEGKALVAKDVNLFKEALERFKNFNEMKTIIDESDLLNKLTI
ncbi:MAG: crosslink repair DNA glycosylase YcaQ family protein [Bacilli bacterium]|nr:crosslink repair DNA glycosylase YcaQ family protein [Bacilli bacterium]